MARKNKKENMIKQIVVGVAITVLGALAVSYVNGAFDSNSNSQPQTIEQQQQQEVQEVLKGRG